MREYRSVLIDTNLLVLFVVGFSDKSLITRHKRTSAFVEEDYHVLCQFLSAFQVVMVTPNILTEASNLLSQAQQPTRETVLGTLASLIGRTREEYVASKEACKEKEFIRLGLTDSAILRRADAVDCVLTVDLSLYLALERSGHNAVNFNHLRVAGWGKGSAAPWTRR